MHTQPEGRYKGIVYAPYCALDPNASSDILVPTYSLALGQCIIRMPCRYRRLPPQSTRAVESGREGDRDEERETEPDRHRRRYGDQTFLLLVVGFLWCSLCSFRASRRPSRVRSDRVRSDAGTGDWHQIRRRADLRRSRFDIGVWDLHRCS